MRAAVLREGTVTTRETPDPVPGSGQILVRTLACGICASDLHFMDHPDADALVRAGDGIARGRIGRDSGLRIVDAILTGVHAPGESHFELLRAFADEATLDRAFAEVAKRGYRSHEFGDSMLLESRSREAIP